MGMNIGMRLVLARKGRGLTQEQLAEKLDVTAQAISTWERNENLPDLKNLIALAKVLDISLDDLVSEKDPPAWELRSPTFSAERMFTYVKAKAQANGLTQTLAALPLMRGKHDGQFRSGIAGIPYAVHPLTLACHAMAMGLMDDDVIAAALLHDVAEDTDTRPEELPVSERVREAVRLVSHNTYGGEEDKEKNKPLYYANIAKNPLAALVKCLDRCNNLACMADGFSRQKMVKYVLQTEEYVLPLLEVVREVPEYNNAAWLLRYQMITMLETLKRLL